LYCHKNTKYLINKIFYGRYYFLNVKIMMEHIMILHPPDKNERGHPKKQSIATIPKGGFRLAE